MDCSMPGSSVLCCLPEFTHHLILCHPFSYCLQPLREPAVKEMAERGLEILLINLGLPGLEAPHSYHGNLVDLASTVWFSNSLRLRIFSIKIVMDRLLDAIIAWLLWLLGDISWGNNLILLVDDYSPIFYILLSSVQFSRSVVSNSLGPHGLQHAWCPRPSPTPGACSNSYPSSQWCHPTVSSSVIPFSFCLQSFPGSGSFPVSQFFASGGRSIGASLATVKSHLTRTLCCIYLFIFGFAGLLLLHAAVR